MEINEFIKKEYSVRDGSIYNTSTGRVQLDSNKLQRDYSNKYPNLAMQLAPIAYQQSIDNIIQEHIEDLRKAELDRERSLNELRSNLASNEDEYILGVMEDENITADNRFREFKKLLNSGEVKTIDADAVEIALKGRLTEYNRSIPEDVQMPRFKKEHIVDRFAYMRMNASNNALAQLQNKLRYKPENAPLLDAWVDDLLDAMYVTTERDIARVVIKHMLWQVKRRIYGKEVSNDLWVAFYGAQGKGKSFTVRNCIFKVIDEFYCETQLSKIDDIDREIRKFSDNYIVNFEELAVGSTGVEERTNKVNKKTMANLKSILTSDKLYVRQMGGQNQLTVNKTFVPISTANEHLFDVVYDESGMRRFFELDLQVPEGMSSFDHAIIADLSSRSEEAWKGVCEWQNEPVWDWNSEVGKKISKIQKTYKPHTNVDDWILHGEYEASETSEMSTKALYRDYKNFCNESGYFPSAISKFVDRMKSEFEFGYKPGRGIYFQIGKSVQTDDDQEVAVKKPRML